MLFIHRSARGGAASGLSCGGANNCTRNNDFMTSWEYSIVALPRFRPPTATRDVAGSPAVSLLNREGTFGWEAVGMTALEDGTVAVLLKRPVGD